MIKLTKIDGVQIYINERYIETIEANPNTTVRIHDGTVYIVNEEPEKVLSLLRDWKQSVAARGKKG